MSEDFQTGFKLDAYNTPCCGASETLNDLVYERPQGFGRFALSAMNPDIRELDELQVKEISRLASCPLKMIYQHL